MKRELVLGCGYTKKPQIYNPTKPQEYENPVFIDINPDVNPDIIFDLNDINYVHGKLPFEDNEFDEIHAYDILEHIGLQGDWKVFFHQFTEFYRVLKPDGFMCITIPIWNYEVAYIDPGHTRVMTPGMFTYLDQNAYKDCGRTSRTDYRFVYKANFRQIMAEVKGQSYAIMLQVIK